MNSKAIKRQLLAAIAMVLVAALALGSSTYAWFVSNTKVQANLSSVSATSASPNLLIVAGAESDGTASTTGGGTVSTLASTASTALYPASTDTCTSTGWWVVNGWTSTASAPLANAYRNVAISEVANGTNVANGTYTQGSQTLNAYQVSTYSIYTTTGEVALNLDPVNPISVAVDTAGTTNPAVTGTGFKDSLRVGVVVDGTLKVVYAPTAETAANGNDSDKTTNSATTVWRTVADASSTKDASYTTLSGTTFTGWTATDNNDGTYTKATNSLGDVDTDGVVVKVYVWLEGTDTNCVVGSADSASDDDSYKVTLNFVGATVDAPTGP